MSVRQSEISTDQTLGDNLGQLGGRIDFQIAFIKCSEPGQARLDNPYSQWNIFLLLPDWRNARQECDAIVFAS